MLLNKYTFAVLEEPCRVVEYELADKNSRFLRSIDSGYFEYVAEVHGQQLETDHRQRAAIALRTAYHHGIETLFTLLGAFVQAPMAVPAWMPRCGTSQLRDLVERFKVGRSLLTPTGKRQLLFRHLAADVHAGVWDEDPERPKVIAGFERIWSRYANDLLDVLQQDEYNSIKHGFRVHAGGFVLRIGLEPEYGVPAPPEAMQTVGASEFGASFYTLETREGERAKRSAIEVRLADKSLNWRVEHLLHSLPLIAMSINNVVSKLRLWSGEEANSLKVQRPADLSAFDEPWRYRTGAFSSSFNVQIPWDEIEAPTRDSLLAQLSPAAQE
jgi:hypothetical protein